MATLAIDWTAVGAVAGGAVALVAITGVVVLVVLAQASNTAAAAATRLAETARELVELGQGLTGRGDQLVEAAIRRAAADEIRGEVAEEQLAVLHEQVELDEQALLSAHAPLLVPTRLAPEGFYGQGALHVMLPDGVYFAPTEQSVGAWTIEPGEHKLVVSCAFRNVGIGPGVLHPYHRIDVVRRESPQPLVSFGGFANGVVAINGTTLVAFPLSAAEPSFGPTLALLDRPDDEIQLMVTLYYRSGASSRPLWTRVRYQRHLRTSPAGLLSEVSLELASPDEASRH
jgi:hypothetical protein